MVTERLESDIGVTVSPPGVLLVDPGEKIELTIAVRNASGQIDNFDIRVEGLMWYELSVAASRLLPRMDPTVQGARQGGDRFESILTISPPQDSTAPAKSYSFGIKVSRSLGQTCTVPVEVIVSPYYNFELVVLLEEVRNQLRQVLETVA